MDSTLHPNLAKLAAAYDEILERLQRGQVSPAAARAEIAQLEARDDQGVRWSLDPDTGDWVRKTALGDAEYDAEPPTSGYATADAYDYTEGSSSFDPSTRLSYEQVSGNGELSTGPGRLAGATQKALPKAAPKKLSKTDNPRTKDLKGRVVGTLKSWTWKVYALIGVCLLAVILGIAAIAGPSAPSTPTPAPSPTAKPTKKPTKNATAKPTRK